MAIDYETPLGEVRLLISDIDEPDGLLLTDEMINAFLRMASDNVNRAAAKALTTIAASEVLVSKYIRTQDLSTDGPKVSAELRALAASLLAEADAADNAVSFFEIVPFEDAFHKEASEYYL